MLAGMQVVDLLVDESGLLRSEIVAKQLAHNRLVGFDDSETLQRLFALLATPDDILQSGLANDILSPPQVELDQLLIPHQWSWLPTLRYLTSS